ncbi:hypothetical protein FEM48_Zijuj03G0039400 [Ziziphus jujuba var. spinosa]|uniref:Cytochrome c oxidase subunit 5C n=1 Tax=Ziziphus jujuba var. spinosa TaxID=714518 RepID=A0A978VN14_ZIZJJ|nr:hypothetical protein FEM48_Zijuj03G0039400 [Ziziphus jujuba var. spinosa]
MAGHKIAHATLKGPSVVKELCIGMVLALAAGSLWKMHHWNEQRKVRTFYDLLDKGEDVLRDFPFDGCGWDVQSLDDKRLCVSVY